MNTDFFKTNEEFSEWIRNHSNKRCLRLYQFLRNEIKSKTETVYGRMNATLDCIVLRDYLTQEIRPGYQSNSKAVLLQWEEEYDEIIKDGVEKLVLKKSQNPNARYLELEWENVNETK
tara:strand:- start:244 stop:597 length:354 start_codon:yes stop_codon:yes gene_type:complete